uniref:Uncharacterized protein n=1 Tax=Rhizophagus irregularis (strain DAOM 181602 / DAOM 197198 / MUCL 43194) TaxID=747089 RepID=U9TEQ9_RHIID
MVIRCGNSFIAENSDMTSRDFPYLRVALCASYRNCYSEWLILRPYISVRSRFTIALRQFVLLYGFYFDKNKYYDKRVSTFTITRRSYVIVGAVPKSKISWSCEINLIGPFSRYSSSFSSTNFGIQLKKIILLLVTCEQHSF